MSDLYEKELAEIARRMREHADMREAMLTVIGRCTCEERSCPTCRILNMALPVGDALAVRKADDDPVHFVACRDDVATGWYFWDETWASRFGPYGDEPKAREMLAKYVASKKAEELSNVDVQGPVPDSLGNCHVCGKPCASGVRTPSGRGIMHQDCFKNSIYALRPDQS
jgi:hypothetical protein